MDVWVGGRAHRGGKGRGMGAGAPHKTNTNTNKHNSNSASARNRRTHRGGEGRGVGEELGHAQIPDLDALPPRGLVLVEEDVGGLHIPAAASIWGVVVFFFSHAHRDSQTDRYRDRQTGTDTDTDTHQSTHTDTHTHARTGAGSAGCGGGAGRGRPGRRCARSCPPPRSGSSPAAACTGCAAGLHWGCVCVRVCVGGGRECFCGWVWVGVVLFFGVLRVLGWTSICIHTYIHTYIHI